MSLINCGGCFQRHPRPSCLFKRHKKPMVEAVTKDTITTMATGGLSQEESAKIFGEDWTSGNVPERGTQAYLDYVEETLKTRTDTYNQKMLDLQTQVAENRLRRISLSPLPPAHSHVGATSGHHSTTDPDESTELHGVASLADKLSKLRPEYYCDPGKSYEKMTFRELIRGCTKVLAFLRATNVKVDGYLAHLSFLMDKAAMGVYTTEGLVLYERSVTTKVLDGVISDWPEVDPSSDSRYLSYEYTFDHMSKSEKPEKSSRNTRRRSSRKSSSILYDFDLWDKNSGDICWMWNCRSCDGCDRRHGVCGLCHEAHRATECEKHLVSPKCQEKEKASN